MEILIGAAITLVIEGVKYVSKRLGTELGAAVIYIAVFILSVVGYAGYTYFMSVEPAAVETIITIIVSAIGVYEVVVKSIIQPAIDRLQA